MGESSSREGPSSCRNLPANRFQGEPRVASLRQHFVLVNLASGERREFATFSDGEFYVIAVKPGMWELRVADGQLEGSGLRASSGALLLDLSPRPGGSRAEGLLVKLVPDF